MSTEAQEPEEQPYYVNNRKEWRRNWIANMNTNTNATYPLDGRETIYEPYEKFLRGTATVGDYLEAYDKVFNDGTVDVPADYGDYLLQRVEDLPIMVDSMNKIDRWGRIEGGYAQPAPGPEDVFHPLRPESD